MRAIVFAGMLLVAAGFVQAEESAAYVRAKGQATDKLILKDYAGARESIAQALKLTTEDYERGDLYRMLETVAHMTGDVAAMTEAMEFQIPSRSKQAYRANRVRRYVVFLRKHNALESAVAKAREKLVQAPEDIVALGIVTYSFERTKLKAPEAVAFTRRFEAANLKIAQRDAQDSEELAARMKENAAMGFAAAAKDWADAGDPERVHLMLKKASEAPAIKDPFTLRLQHENSGDALCLIGQVEEGVKHYEAAIKVEDSELQKGWLKGKIDDVRKGKKPQP